MNKNNDEQADRLVESLNQLRKVIGNCPQDWLIHLYEKKTGQQFVPEFVSNTAINEVAKLKEMAAFGSEKAIRELASIATNISEFLCSLVGDDKDKTQQDVNAGKLVHREVFPEGNWQADYRCVSKIIARLSLEKIDILQTMQGQLQRKYSPPIRILGAIGMFSSKVWRRLCNKQQDSSEESSERQARQFREVDFLIARIFEDRAQHLARESARKVLRSASFWPVIAEASGQNARSMEYGIREAGLGSTLGYKLPRPKAGQQEIRTLINEVFTAIEGQRQYGLKMSPSHRAEYEQYENCKLLPQVWKPKDRILARLEELETWNPTSHWMRKAALLPHPDSKDLAKWVDAGMAWLESCVAEVRYEELLKEYPDANPRNANHLRIGAVWARCSACREETMTDHPSACPDCVHLRDSYKTQYIAWARNRVQLLERLEKGLDHAFDSYPWPDSVQKRAEKGKTAKAVWREKLEDGFSVNLKTEV